MCVFFKKGNTELEESANEGQEARFMVFAMKHGLMPSLERCLQWQIQEAAARASLEAYATNNLSFIGTRLTL
jgi:hypothetical protein